MAYDRYDTRHGPQDDRNRWSSERGSRERGRPDREDRGFFERAADEIGSWFGGDDDDHARYREGRGQRDERWEQQQRREPWGGGDRERSFGRDEDRDRGSYRPMTGDYGRSERERFDNRRSEGFFAASGVSRGGRDRDADRDHSRWDRDEYRTTSFAGSADRSQHQDPHYQSWRERQMADLDREYEQYRREHQAKFESEFGSWRQQRQTKRQMLGQIREHMEVFGSDEQRVGTVDKVAGDRIILTKNDPEAGGAHHSLGCSELDRVEGERVILGCTAEQARQRWQDEDRNRALFERDGDRDSGPHMLDRSFSGTYR